MKTERQIQLFYLSLLGFGSVIVGIVVGLWSSLQ